MSSSASATRSPSQASQTSQISLSSQSRAKPHQESTSEDTTPLEKKVSTNGLNLVTIYNKSLAY